MKRRTRIALYTLAAALAAAALGLWLARDLPRRLAEGLLAEALGAEVRLGGIALEAGDHLVLSGLEVRRMASLPPLAELRIAEVQVHGHWKKLLARDVGRIEVLRLEARLVPSDEPIPPPRPLDLRVARIEVPGARVTLEAGAETALLELDAAFDGLGAPAAHPGAFPPGEIRLRADRLPAAAVLPFLPKPARDAAASLEGARVEGLEATLTQPTATASTPAPLAIDARAQRLLRESAAGSWQLDAPAIGGTAPFEDGKGGAEGGVLLALQGRLAGLERAALTARLGEAGVEMLEAELSGVDLARWVPLLVALPAGWDLEGSANLEARGSAAEGLAYRLTATLPAVSMPAVSRPLASRPAAPMPEPGGALHLGGLEVEATGTLDLESLEGPLEASVRLARVDVPGRPLDPGLLPLAGRFEGAAGLEGSPRASGAWDLEAGRTLRLHADGAGRLEDGLPHLDLAWRLAPADLVRLREVAAAAGLLPEKLGGVAVAELEVAGRLGASGRVQGPASAAHLRARLDLQDLFLRGPSPAGEGRILEIRSPRLAANLGGRLGRPGGRSAAIAIEVEETDLTLAAPPLDPLTLKASAAGGLDPEGPGLRLDEARLDAGALGVLTLRGAVDAREAGEARLALAGADLELWIETLRPMIGDPAPGYSFQGRLDADLAARLTAGGWSGVGEAALTAGGFSSADGSRVGQSLAGRWSLTGHGAEGEHHLEADGTAGGFVVLWDAFFADYGALEAALKLAGSIAEDTGAWTLRAEGALEEAGGVVVTLESREDGALGYSLRLDAPDLSVATERWLKGPFQGSVPALERLEVAGTASLSATGELGSGRLAVSGGVQVAGARLFLAGEEVGIEGLDLDLPLDLVWEDGASGGPGTVRGPPRQGFLRFARLRAGGLEVPATESALTAEGESLRLAEPLVLAFFGGSLRFEDLVLADLARPSRHLESALVLDRLQLAEASKAFDLVPLEGELTGSFPRIYLTGDTFRTEGDAELAAFGGSVTVRDISGRDLLSRYPRLTFSATLKEIDLQQVTRTFDFGEMTGILQGELTNFQLFRGVPVRFRGRLETVERKGVPRRIDVKAINNLAILGTGSKIGVLDRGIQRFLDRYTYSRLGIEMELVRDRFLLRGLERRGERELFLRGRLPFPIDVVNAQPGQTVSFSTMLGRLESLDFAAATTTP